MKKIQTIFERKWDGNRGVIDKPMAIFDPNTAMATEKLDGTNVRLTVRNHKLVRVEKRHNPTKRQKIEGINDPWYSDAFEYEPSDKYIWEASINTDLSSVEDGEWSGEAVGPKIQGNPLNLEKHEVVLFSNLEVRVKRLVYRDKPPIEFEKLGKWLKEQKSLIGNDCGIEGVVWHLDNGEMVKIKTQDFK